MRLQSEIRLEILVVKKTLEMLADHVRAREFRIVARYCRGLVCQILPFSRKNVRATGLSSRFHESIRFDVEHGIDTAGIIRVKDLGSASANTADAGNYAPSRPSSVRQMLATLEDLNFENYAFIDLGSGKGRVLLLASKFPFKKIIGVEFSAKLHETAEENVRRYSSTTQQCTDIECICADATRFELPADPIVLYFFSPFRGKVMSRVLDNIEASFNECARDIIIFFVSSRTGHTQLASVLSYNASPRGTILKSATSFIVPGSQARRTGHRKKISPQHR